MITFEEKLGEIFSQIPDFIDKNNKLFKVRYNWGTIDVLNKFLILPENSSKYPLIWLTVNEEEENIITKTIKKNAKIIIATHSDKVDSFNDFIFQTDYKEILLPVYNNVITALIKSGVVIISDLKIKRELSPNYSVKNNEKGLIDIWNVLAFTINIEIDGKKCINKNIKF